MSKQLNKTTLSYWLMRKALTGFKVVLFVVALTGVFLYTRVGAPERASAAIPTTLNFQARLLQSNGAIVPDGYYNVEFKLYDATSAGNLMWTETRYDSNGATAGNDNRVQVRSGYLSVYLGDINTNLSSLDWMQQYWLTMNIGGTTQTASPTWDGEMNPRLRLTSVPYAQAASRADTLDGIDSTGFAQLAPGSVQGVNSANSALRLNQTGAGNLLQLQGDGSDVLTLTKSGVLTVSGAATFNGGLTVASGQQLTNSGSTLLTALAISNLPTGGAIGTAAATVDVASSFTVNQTTAGQTLSLPSPTSATAGRIVFVANVGTQDFAMHGVTVSSVKAQSYIWNGSAWVSTNIDGAGAGATSVGTLDGATKNANGGVINANQLFLQTADATYPGLVSTGNQSFAGDKTFGGQIVANGGIDLGTDTIQGTTAVIDFTNFDVDASGNTTIGGTLGVSGDATFSGNLTVNTGDQFTNAGSTLFTAITISDVASGGNIGTAAATVDVATTFNINQTTTGQTLTLPNPTDTTAGRVAFVNNVGSASFTMYNSVIATGRSNTFIWNGSVWVTTVSLSGSVVNSIGTVDSVAKSADGASIVNNALYLQYADATYPGLVSVNAQTFAGDKTFTGTLTVTNATTDITTGANQDLTVVANGTGIINLNDTVRVGTLGTADTDSLVCRNSNGQLATCSTATLGGTAFIQGGNSFGATAVLGTNDTQSLAFETDGVTRLTIDTSGNATLTGNLTVNGTGTSSFAGSLQVDGNTTLGNASTDTLTITGTSVSIPNNLNFDSNTLFIDASNNRVGLGTTAPITRLHVQAYNTGISYTPNGRTAATFEGSSNGTVLQLVAPTGAAQNEIWFGSPTNENLGRVRYEMDNNALALYTNGSEKFRIDNAGRVGLNDTTPDAQLDIQISDAARTGLIVQGAASQSADLFQAQNDVGVVALKISASGILTVGATPGTGTSGLVTAAGASASTPRFVARGAASQTGDLLQNQANGGTLLSGFNAAGNLFYSNSTFTNTIQTASLTGNQTITLPNATGTVLLDSTLATTAFIQNGNSFGAEAVLGTNDNFDLAFETNGTTRLTVTAAGKVGVGTLSPVSQIDVRGVAAQNGTGTLSSSGTTVTGSGTVFTSELAVGENIVAAGQTRTITAITSNTQITVNTAFTPDLIPGTNFTYTRSLQIWRNSTGGVVGRFNSDGRFIIGNSASTVGMMRLQTDVTARAGLVIQGVSGQTADLFIVQNDSGNTQFKVSPDGSTGIGTGSTALTAKLQVQTTSGLVGQIIRAAASQTADLMQFQNDSATVLSRITSNGGLAVPTVHSVSGTGAYIQTAGDTSSVMILANGAANKALVVRSSASQTADLVQVQNSDGSQNYFRVDSVGRTFFGADRTILGATDSGARLSINPTSSSQAGLIIRGVSSQSGDLQQNMAQGTLLSGFNAAGNLFYSNSTFTSIVQSATLTGNQTITLPNATGTVLLDSTLASTAFVQGGNSFGATAVLGTNDANSLAFETSGTTRLVVDTSGNLTFQGNNTLSSTGTLTINTAAANGLSITSGTTGVLTLDSGTTGAINLGTNANAKTITIGNGTGATSLVLNAGTGAINIGTNTVARTITVGNATGASALVLASGTGDVAIQSQDDINIGTNAVAQDIAIGNATGATSVSIQSGTGAISIGTGAQARILNIGTGAAAQTLTLGSTNTTSSTTIQGGSGGILLSGATTINNTLTFSGVATDITTGTNEDLTVVANGTGIIDLNDTVRVGTLAATDTDSYALCRDASSGQLSACDANTTGRPFLQGGNSFGATAVLGTTGANDIEFITNGTTRLTIDTSGNATLAGNLGVGTPTSGYVFEVGGNTGGAEDTVALIAGTSTSTTGTSRGSFSVLTANPGAASDAWYQGSFGSANILGSNVTAATGVGVEGEAYYSGSGTLGAAYGVVGYTHNFGTGTITNAASLLASTNIKDAGTITNNYGLKVENQNAGTNNYGIYINQTTNGATDYALYVDGGAKSYFSGNVTIAANQSISLTGGTTAQRPASPTEGMMFFDTTTKQLLTYSNGKWQATNGEYVIVAASNSSQSIKDAAHYVADGDNVPGAGTIDGDQVQINAALTAAAGGKVYLAAGTYVADATILVPNNTTLAGAGRGTLIELADIDATDNLIENSDTTTGTGVTIQDIRLDGRSDLNTAGTQHGIYFNGMGGGGGSSTRQGAKLSHLWTEKFRNDNMYINASANTIVTGVTTKGGLTGINVTDSTAVTVTGSLNQNSSYAGFYIYGGNTNTFTANTVEGSSNSGFRLEGSTANNTISGNTANNITAAAIYIRDGANNNTVTGNTLYNNGYGIRLSGALRNTIAGNNIRQNSSRGIYLESGSHNNLISANILHSNGGTGGNQSVEIDNSDSNSITNNSITDVSATTTNYAIHIVNSTSDANYLADNTLGGGSINDAGTGTIYGGQVNGSGNYVIEAQAGTIELQSNTNVTGNLTVSGNGDFAGTLAVGSADQFQVDASGNVSTSGTLTVTNATTDLTTGTNQDLTVVANGTGIVDLNDTVRVGTLAAADTDSYALCRDASSGQLAACDANTTGRPFLQGGNSFGAQAVLGTNDSNSLVFETNGTTRLTIASDGSTITLNGITTDLTTGTNEDLTVVANGTGVINLNDSITAGGDITFSAGASRTLGVQTQTSNVAGNGLTISAGAAGAGASAFSGGTLSLQGGAAAGTGNANGGNVVLTGGTGVGTGVRGLVVVDTATFSAATVQNFTGSGSITQANIDTFGTILISSNASGYTATLGDPTNLTAGRIVYVTNTGLFDMTMSVNGGGTGNTITLKPSTTATMVWNGSDWTAAGASSSTDLQAAYNNTATSAGGAELILNAPGGSADGLTIRNNATTPITGGILEVQSSIGTNLFSVNNLGTELADNGGAETSGTFATNWTAAPAGGTVTRTTTSGQYVTGQAGVQVVTGAVANHGVRNNLSGNPVVSTTYTVSFAARLSSGTFSTLQVAYSRDGGTDIDTCANYSSQTLSTSVWTKITCTITTDSTTATNPDLIIRQTDATARTFWIDNLSFVRNDSTTQPSNVQIGGGINGGQVTLFTLDRSSSPPVANGDTTYLGSMYYDTTTGRIQCYESDGWGACGSAPDNIIVLTPEYAGAVLNGSGVGTMTADFCANQASISFQVNSSFCTSGLSRQYYRWTSPQATMQTYSIYVSYKLPNTFKTFNSDNTITLTGYTDHNTNGDVTYEVFRSTGSAITRCSNGTDETEVTTAANTWQTVAINGNETACGFVGGDNIIFKINVKAMSNANVYVENLNFTYTNQ